VLDLIDSAIVRLGRKRAQLRASERQIPAASGGFERYIARWFARPPDRPKHA